MSAPRRWRPSSWWARSQGFSWRRCSTTAAAPGTTPRNSSRPARTVGRGVRRTRPPWAVIPGAIRSKTRRGAGCPRALNSLGRSPRGLGPRFLLQIFARQPRVPAVPQAGSAYAYSYATLGELVAWVIGWDLILEYAVGNVAVAISWADYFTSLLRSFDVHLPVWLTTGYRTALLSPDPAVHGLLQTAPHVAGIPRSEEHT